MKLAIIGHATRGKEVIEVLEMLGGKNDTKEPYDGSVYKGRDDAYYYIDENNYIRMALKQYGNVSHFTFITLEEFLEKFPYKVGDKVRVAEYESEVRIDDMKWDGNEILYEVFTDETEWYSAEELNNYNQPHKEETMEEKENSVVVNNEHKQLKVHSLRYDKVQLMIDDKYELKQEGNAYYIVRKKKEYPKTYEECRVYLAKQMGCDCNPYSEQMFSKIPIDSFCRLISSRNAYWKIAGDWKPEYRLGKKKYCIMTKDNKVVSATVEETNRILTFPTAEMRDAFYENFKDLIEKCKELL